MCLEVGDVLSKHDLLALSVKVLRIYFSIRRDFAVNLFQLRSSATFSDMSKQLMDINHV